jgi:hypothetical protein
LFRIFIFVQILKLFIFWILFIIWKLFIFCVFSNLKIVYISNLFTYEKCSYMKFVHIRKMLKLKNCLNLKIVRISNLFIYENCSYHKIVHISNFENCSYFEFWKLFIFLILKIVHILKKKLNFKIIHISIFCSKLKIVHISNFIQTKKKKKEKHTHWISWAAAQLDIPCGRGMRPLVPAPPTGGV